MVRPGRDPLKGKVEMDEAFDGGVSTGTGSDGVGKALIAIAAKEEGTGIGRIRLARVTDASTPSLHGFIERTIASGSTVHTDGWAPYQGLEKLGYSHVIIRLKGRAKEAAVESLTRVHRVASLLKRWLLRTQLDQCTWTTIWMNSPSDLIIGDPPHAGNSSSPLGAGKCRSGR